MCGKKYGFVIFDWNMELMMGYDLLCEVCVDLNFVIMFFIMIMVEFKIENVIVVKKVGVNNYIVKLFNVVMLKIKIEVVFLDMVNV